MTKLIHLSAHQAAVGNMGTDYQRSQITVVTFVTVWAFSLQLLQKDASFLGEGMVNMFYPLHQSGTLLAVCWPDKTTFWKVLDLSVWEKLQNLLVKQPSLMAPISYYPHVLMSLSHTLVVF